MRPHRYLSALIAAGAAITVATGSSAQAAPIGAQAVNPVLASPYLYFGWGSPPSPTTVMAAANVKAFTLAFMLSNGGCTPAWDGSRALNGTDATRISQIRSAGGDVIVSFGGWSGNKLGERCTSASALANAYQQVINAYRLTAIDIDIENTEMGSDAAQDRVLGALKIIKQNNPSVKTVITMGTATNGPESRGQRLITRAQQLGANVDVWTIMPFDFTSGGQNMATLTQSASEGLKNRLKAAFGWSDDTAYRRMGISSMNGRTDTGETVTLANFNTILSYAQQHHLARFTYWSTNRDRPCGSGTSADACSGISQASWDFSKVIGRYNG